MPSSIRSRPDARAPLAALIAALLLALLSPTAARAADPGTRARAEAQARTKFAEGNTAYDKGEFQVALDAYVEAYRLMPLPGFLFNIAQCHRQLGHAERAGFYYRRYLALSKQTPPNAPLVRELIAEMDEAVKKQQEPKPSREEPPKAVALRTQAEEVAARRAREDSERKRAAAAAAPTPEAEVKSESLASKWWVWAGAGAVAVVAGGVIYAATAPEARPVSLGTIR